jgi:hypothetical protein
MPGQSRVVIGQSGSADGNEVVVSADGVHALAVRDEESLDALKVISKELRKIRFLLEAGMNIDLTDVDLDEDR